MTNWSVLNLRVSLWVSLIQASRSFGENLTRELGAASDQSRQVSVDDILLWW